MKKLFKSFIAASFLIFPTIMEAQTMQKISASSDKIQYVGRVDNSNPENVIFAYPGVSIKAKFQGSSIDALLTEYGQGGSSTTNYFYAIIDDGSPTLLKLSSSQSVYEIARNLGEGEHTIELFKLTESAVGSVGFNGFQLEEGKSLLTPDPLPARKIEFIGNSITCGYGNESSESTPLSGFTSVNENNYKAWGAVTSRNLDAQYSCVAYSGRGLYMNNSGTKTSTLPLIYDQTIADKSAYKWDPSRYIPDVVVINLGTNDFAAESSSIENVDSSVFVNTYISFLQKLRGYYPDATFICATGVMMSDSYPSGKMQWTRIQSYVSSVKDYMNANGDSKVYYLSLDPQSSPYGEDWHPTAATHNKMATKLTSFINGLATSPWATSASKGEIAHWEKNKKASVVLTFDDWSAGHPAIVVPELKNKNMVATFNIVPSIVSYWSGIQTAASYGNEIANHTTNHLYADEASLYESEIMAAKNTLESKISNQKVYTFAYPYGSYDDGLIAYLKSSGHIAARGVNPPSSTKDYSYDFISSEDDYFKMKTYGMTTTTALNNYTSEIDKVVKYGGVLVYLYHSVYSQTVTDNNYAQILDTDFKAQLDALKSYEDRVWITTYANAIKYHREAKCASISEIQAPSNGKWIINLSDTLSNNETYNYPLTLLLKMDGVNYNVIKQNGQTIEIDSIFNDTIMFRAIPDGGEITLEVSGILIQASVTPQNINDGDKTTINLLAKISAEEENVPLKIWADLSSIGGSTEQNMTLNESGYYECSLSIEDSLGAGTKILIVKVEDNTGDIKSVNLPFEVVSVILEPLGESLLLADCEDGTLTKIGTNWFSFNDNADGGASIIDPLPFDVTEGGANGTGYAAKINYSLDKGELEYDPYVGFGFMMNEDEPLDLSSSTGIVFYHKGDGVILKVQLSTVTNYNDFAYEVPAHAEWTRVVIPWEDFMQANWGTNSGYVDFETDKITAFQWQEVPSVAASGTGTTWIDEVSILGISKLSSVTMEDNIDRNNCLIYADENRVYIKTEKAMERISLISLYGTLLSKIELKNDYFTVMENLPSSVYLLNIQFTDGSLKTMKIIK